MKHFSEIIRRFRRWLAAAGIALLCLLTAFWVWQCGVRPFSGKCFSVKICDNYENFYTVEESVSQTFTTSFDVQNLTFMFQTVGEHPQGELSVSLFDDESGELISTSTGVMGNIISGQYTGLGMSALADSAGADRRYRVELVPHYETEGRLAIGYSAAVVREGEALLLDGTETAGNLAQYISSAPIGRFLNLFYWGIALALTGLVCGVYLLAGTGWFRLHIAAFVLVLVFGTVFTAVLPPYSAPDEQFHINESFTIASWWSNRVSRDEWVMQDVPIFYSYRRPGDFNSIMEDQKTTVFTWKEYTYHLADTTTDKLGDHVWLFEAQADSYPVLYFFSALGVFLAFCLHLGFAPALLLGRAFNLLVFAAMAALAVKKAPFGKTSFFGAALLPMTLHLAASFSRDSLLLGCCFLFTALCLDAAFGTEPLHWKKLVPIAVLGMIFAPAKVVYCPLLLLTLLIPAMRLGIPGKKLALERRGKIALGGAAVFLVLCLGLVVWNNRYLLASSASTDENQTSAAEINQEIQQEYQDLLEEIGEESVVAQSHSSGAVQSSDTETQLDDTVCYTIGYILTHIPDTIQLCVNSVIQLGDHYLKTLVGGNLSYYSLDLAWGWVMVLYALLFCCALVQPGDGMLTGGFRLWVGLLALGSAGLALLGCICWTPTYYTTIYGFQGRYLLPVLPLALLALRPAGLHPAKNMTAGLVTAFAVTDAAVVLNIMLAIVAR